MVTINGAFLLWEVQVRRIATYPSGGAVGDSLMQCLQDDLILVLRFNYVSVISCFEYNEVFLLIGIDVIYQISTYGAAYDYILVSRFSIANHIDLTQ